MKLGNQRESTNFEDRTGIKPTFLQEVMWGAQAMFNRAMGDKRQKQIDEANKIYREHPLPPMTSEQAIANLHAKVSRVKGGWNVKTPGQPFDTFLPSYAPTPYDKGEKDGSGLRPEEMQAIEGLIRKARK